MKAVYILFVSVCFILLGGYKYTYANSRNTASPSPYPSEKAHEIKSAFIGHDHAALRAISALDEKKFLISDEDEDEYHLSARKYVLLVKSSLVLSFIFVLGYSYSLNKERLPSCMHLSHASTVKYLTQRSLRI